MKKNFLKVAYLTAFGLIAGYNFYISQDSELSLTDIVLENVEALASESGNYRCIAPYTIKCSQEGSQRIPGYRTAY